MRSLWVLGLLGLLGGCSFLAHDAVKGRCSLAPPVVDTAVALAGFVAAGAAISDTDADAEAHGQDEIIHATTPAHGISASSQMGVAKAMASRR